MYVFRTSGGKNVHISPHPPGVVVNKKKFLNLQLVTIASPGGRYSEDESKQREEGYAGSQAL